MCRPLWFSGLIVSNITSADEDSCRVVKTSVANEIFSFLLKTYSRCRVIVCFFKSSISPRSAVFRHLPVHKLLILKLFPLFFYSLSQLLPSFSVNVPLYLHQYVSHITTWGKVLKIYCGLNHNPARPSGSFLKIYIIVSIIMSTLVCLVGDRAKSTR